MTAPRHQQASDIVEGVPGCARHFAASDRSASLAAGAIQPAARAYVFMHAAGASWITRIAVHVHEHRARLACCVASRPGQWRDEYVCAARPARNRTPTILITPAPRARDCTRNGRDTHTDVHHWGRPMQLKRNMMTLALLSAGIGLATCANIAFAASAPAGGAQDQPQQQDQTATTDQNANGKKKNEKQKTQPQQLQAINVRGYAGSLQNATAIKRNSDEIVEAVSAEQIGKLPGTSIADTLGRLPGLAVQTLSGRPQVLTIHGLGPDFSTALVNGREQVSTSNNRDVQYDQYPSSLFNSVVVYMSPSASLIGQGLSGTVAAVNAHYVWDSLSTLSPGPGVSDHGYSVNGVYVNQFADHTFGVTLGV